MKRFCMALLTGLAVLAVQASRSDAASRYVGASGTSSGSGGCSITIESFDPNGAPGIRPMVVINVAIPNASTAANSAALIRADLAAGLGPDYEATLPAGMPGVVKINHKAGVFSMSISETVPGQVIQEVSLNLPMARPVGVYALGLLLMVGGLVALMRRKPATAEVSA